MHTGDCGCVTLLSKALYDCQEVALAVGKTVGAVAMRAKELGCAVEGDLLAKADAKAVCESYGYEVDFAPCYTDDVERVTRYVRTPSYPYVTPDELSRATGMPSHDIAYMAMDYSEEYAKACLHVPMSSDGARAVCDAFGLVLELEPVQDGTACNGANDALVRALQAHLRDNDKLIDTLVVQMDRLTESVESLTRTVETMTGANTALID